jgi:hypothetical protein
VRAPRRCWPRTTVHFGDVEAKARVDPPFYGSHAAISEAPSRTDELVHRYPAELRYQPPELVCFLGSPLVPQRALGDARTEDAVALRLELQSRVALKHAGKDRFSASFPSQSGIVHTTIVLRLESSERAGHLVRGLLSLRLVYCDGFID